MATRVSNFFRRLVQYLWNKVLVYDLGLMLLAALSFIFTGNLTPTAYSERLFWIGIIVFLIAGVMILAYMFPSRMLMFPYNIRKPEDAKKFFDDAPANRRNDEKRLDFGFQVWLIGFVCLGVAALVQTFLG